MDNNKQFNIKLNDMWIIIISIWFLIGIITSIVYVIDSIIKKTDLKVKDFLLIIAWIILGPILWTSIGIVALTDFIQNHLDDDIIKFK